MDYEEGTSADLIILQNETHLMENFKLELN